MSLRLVCSSDSWVGWSWKLEVGSGGEVGILEGREVGFSQEGA